MELVSHWGYVTYAIFFSICFTFTIFLSAFSPLVALFNKKLTKERKFNKYALMKSLGAVTNMQNCITYSCQLVPFVHEANEG